MTAQPHEPAAGAPTSRYVVGIDLGTTNSALAYVDSKESPWRIRTLPLPQVVAAGEVDDRPTLPSFLCQATAAEQQFNAFALPWSDAPQPWAVGAFARDESSSRPGRVVSSAKSWLSHSGVDRSAALLPWRGDPDVERLSPVDAAAAVLRHLHDVWNHRFPQHPLAEQDLVITLPASFDEVARELTLAAAKQAGLPRVVLLEEPQAAFHAWIDRHRDDWRELVSPGQKILVCDIGGGTSDFTLIRVGENQESGDLEFHRVAVGDHLLLGGDNLDLALARSVEAQLAAGGRLESRQWEALVRSARRVKETLLADNAPESLTIHLPAAGSKLIAAGLQAEVTRTDAAKLLVDGFLPRVDLDAQPQRGQSGFQDFGLPFAADPAITRHLAHFLTCHRHTGDELPALRARPTDAADPARPDVVLFNGGFFASPLLRDRLVEALGEWFTGPDADWTPRVLDSQQLDLAVACGAAYYGMVRRGDGVGITATLARSYYVGVAGPTPRAVCLAPGVAKAGDDFEVSDLEFELTLAEPVEFPIYVSSTRLVDAPGQLIGADPAELTPLPPIRTVLHASRKTDAQVAKVRLHAHLSEIGMLELSCRSVDSQRSWRLQFDVRSTTETDLKPHESSAEGEGFVDDELLTAARAAIEAVFGESAAEPPSKLMKSLTAALDLPKHEWPTSVLRRLWETLMECEPGRRRSAAHESRWLNLVGYSLRPGYGFAVDDWRVAQTWRAVSGKLAFPSSLPESLILWRRLAGGLADGPQQGLAEPLLADVRALRRRYSGGKAKAMSTALDPTRTAEIWRLLGALELLTTTAKTELGDAITELLPKRKLAPRAADMVWTLSRLGQRKPLYGPLNTVVPAEVAERWLQAIMDWAGDPPVAHFAAMQLARRTDDRHRDIAEPRRDAVLAWLRRHEANDHLVQLVETGGALEAQERQSAFGESLPAGLRLSE
ncbi:Chaperone protein DnaK [Posidoniimonas corsicana]|uniref:Chaperone protein DnaK n=1 Tax=Posidoniimonas corsicana TaxID=1938618 RepID=A0A5C5V3J9_9BACT|nr:hsp70 family protein [Posidoniimonas corsicana]TWT32322.1 Chaperone protein DnaK [Posidoniimonas corsicana]